ncbi:unnamed protein product [Prorocentrum cordatum]|uniref:Apple domain-containing protein n=1 Tax=Prorocentrum cordatum TaxID=2364126 RepID=A0ABN9TRB6_9DINO|nr:unnamed protein product [Polarella glacialis]
MLREREPADVTAALTADTDTDAPISNGRENRMQVSTAALAADTDEPATCPEGSPAARPPPWAVRGALCLAAACGAAGLAAAARHRRGGGPPPRSLVVPQEGRDQLEPLPASTAPYELRRRTGCGNWAEILLGSGVLVAGAEECASRCTQRGDCRAFNYQSGGVALHCHAAKEASKAGKGWCYLFAEGCQTGADKCNDLYVPRTAGVNFTLARQGTGCANWERIGMGETTVAGSARQCAGWCSASAGCRGFNWQPSACSDGEQVQRGACILFRSLCAVEENACWDMYEVNGLSLLELTDALRPGSFADPEEALAQFPITVPGCDLAELTLEANVDLQELFLDRVKGTVAGALANEGLETGSIAVELFDGSGSVIANCVIKTGDVAAVASALTARKGEIASDVCSALAAAPGLASVACLGEGACSAGGAIVAKLADGSAGTSAPTLAPTPPSTVATTSTSTSATEASTSTSATEASTSTSVTEASTGTSSTVVSTSLPEPALEISTTVTLSTPEPALEMSTTATLATTTITETTAGSLRTTFTLPAGSIPDDPEAAAAVLKRLAEVLAEETGAHASASLGQQHERRLSAAASGQEVEVTFDPGSPELAALLDERRDELTSKLSETAAAAAREAEDSRAPGAATSASSADCGDGGDHFDAIVYAVLGVGAVGALLLCGYAAVACCHEAKKRGRESPREARERLVPPGEQAPGAGADEGAAVQRAQKLPSVGPGGAEAETNLVEGAAAGATALTVRSTNGFGRGDRVQITSHRGSETKVVCGFDGDTGAMLVHTGLFYAHAMGAFVSKVRGPRPADTTPTGVDDGPPEEPDDAPLMIPPTPRSSSSRSGSHWSGPGDAAEAAGWAVTLEAGSAGRPLGLSLVPVEDDEGGALLVGCVHDESRASDWNGELQATAPPPFCTSEMDTERMGTLPNSGSSKGRHAAGGALEGGPPARCLQRRQGRALRPVREAHRRRLAHSVVRPVRLVAVRGLLPRGLRRGVEGAAVSVTRWQTEVAGGARLRCHGPGVAREDGQVVRGRRRGDELPLRPQDRRLPRLRRPDVGQDAGVHRGRPGRRRRVRRLREAPGREAAGRARTAARREPGAARGRRRAGASAARLPRRGQRGPAQGSGDDDLPLVINIPQVGKRHEVSSRPRTGERALGEPPTLRPKSRAEMAPRAQAQCGMPAPWRGCGLEPHGRLSVHQPGTPPRSGPRATSALRADLHLWDLHTGSDTQGVDPPPGLSGSEAGSRVPPLVDLRAALASDGVQLFSSGSMPCTAASPLLSERFTVADGDRAASGTPLSADWHRVSGDSPSQARQLRSLGSERSATLPWTERVPSESVPAPPTQAPLLPIAEVQPKLGGSNGGPGDLGAEPSAVASCSDPGSLAAPRCTLQTPAMPTAAMRRTQARPEADLGAARTTAAALPPFRASTLSPLPGCRADAHSVAPRANSAPALLAGRSLGAAAMLRATREQAANATTAGAAQLRAVLPWGHSAERSKERADKPTASYRDVVEARAHSGAQASHPRERRGVGRLCSAAPVRPRTAISCVGRSRSAAPAATRSAAFSETMCAIDRRWREHSPGLRPLILDGTDRQSGAAPSTGEVVEAARAEQRGRTSRRKRREPPSVWPASAAGRLVDPALCRPGLYRAPPQACTQLPPGSRAGPAGPAFIAYSNARAGRGHAVAGRLATVVDDVDAGDEILSPRDQTAATRDAAKKLAQTSADRFSGKCDGLCVVKALVDEKRADPRLDLKGARWKVQTIKAAEENGEGSEVDGHARAGRSTEGDIAMAALRGSDAAPEEIDGNGEASLLTRLRRPPSARVR